MRCARLLLLALLLSCALSKTGRIIDRDPVSHEKEFELVPLKRLHRSPPVSFKLELLSAVIEPDESDQVGFNSFIGGQSIVLTALLNAPLLDSTPASERVVVKLSSVPQTFIRILKAEAARVPVSLDFLDLAKVPEARSVMGNDMSEDAAVTALKKEMHDAADTGSPLLAQRESLVNEFLTLQRMCYMFDSSKAKLSPAKRARLAHSCFDMNRIVRPIGVVVSPNCGPPVFEPHKWYFTRDIEAYLRAPPPSDCDGLPTHSDLRGIVFEYCAGGTLETEIDFQRQNERKRTQSFAKYERWLLNTVYQMSSALSFVHIRKIAWRDLKPSNVLYCGAPSSGVKDKDETTDSSGDEDEVEDEEPHRYLKLHDWGTAALQFSEASPPPDVATLSYVPPEGTGVDPFWAADMFALGQTLSQMVLGEPFFFNFDAADELSAQSLHRNTVHCLSSVHEVRTALVHRLTTLFLQQNALGFPSWMVLPRFPDAVAKRSALAHMAPDKYNPESLMDPKVRGALEHLVSSSAGATMEELMAMGLRYQQTADQQIAQLHANMRAAAGFRFLRLPLTLFARWVDRLFVELTRCTGYTSSGFVQPSEVTQCTHLSDHHPEMYVVRTADHTRAFDDSFYLSSTYPEASIVHSRFCRPSASFVAVRMATLAVCADALPRAMMNVAGDLSAGPTMPDSFGATTPRALVFSTRHSSWRPLKDKLIAMDALLTVCPMTHTLHLRLVPSSSDLQELSLPLHGAEINQLLIGIESVPVFLDMELPDLSSSQKKFFCIFLKEKNSWAICFENTEYAMRWLDHLRFLSDCGSVFLK